jgi:hypothetical protein
MVALLDGAEREHASPTSRSVASLVELLVLALVVLVVVAAAQGKLGRSSPGLTAGMSLGSEEATSTSG